MFNKQREVNEMTTFTANELDLAMYMAAIGMIYEEDYEKAITPEQTQRLRAWYAKFDESPNMRKITADAMMEHILQKMGA